MNFKSYWVGLTPCLLLLILAGTACDQDGTSTRSTSETRSPTAAETDGESATVEADAGAEISEGLGSATEGSAAKAAEAEAVGGATDSDAAASLPPGHLPMTMSGGLAAPPEGGFAYALPEGWQAEEPSMMRKVNLSVPGDPPAQAYVTILRGMGGGVAANFNRWRGQLGQPPLSAGEIEALEKIELLGQQTPLIEIDGDYVNSMRPGDSISGARLLGAIAIVQDASVFVKFVGSRETVAAERERFIAFCASLQRQ